jgi:ribonuclease P protein component
MRRFAGLRRQANFARLRQRGRRIPTKNLTLYLGDAAAGDSTSLVGITVNKTIGKAVLRNTLRRRLAAIVNEALPSDRRVRLVIVARPTAGALSFAALRDELCAALTKA